MPSIRFPQAVRCWSNLRIGIVTLLTAAAINGVIGHFGMQVDRTRMEQVHIAHVHEALGSVLNDVDSLLLGEQIEEVEEDVARLSRDVDDIAASVSEADARELRAAFRDFSESARRQTEQIRAGRRDLAQRIDRTATDPSHDRVESALLKIDAQCEARAKRQIAATYTTSFLSLLFSAILVSYLAARYRQRTTSMADLEVQRRSVEASERRLKFHYDLVEAKRGLTDSREIVGVMVGFLARHLGVTSGAFAIKAPDGSIHALCAFGPHAESRGAALWSSPLRTNALVGELTFADDVRAEFDAPRTAELRDLSIEAYVCSPIARNGEFRAALIVAHDAPRAWTAEELSLIEEVGTRCFARFRQAEAEAATRRSEEHVQFFFDAINNGVWERDFQSGKVVWSEGMFALLGLDSETAPSVEAMRALVVPEDLEAFEAVLEPVDDRSYSTRLRFRNSEGRTVPVLAQSRTQFDVMGSPIRSIGTLTDLTQLEEAETAKREIEHRSQWTRALLEAQVHSSVDGILIVDPEGRIVLKNHRMAEIWGIPDEIARAEDDARQIEFVLKSVKDPDEFIATVQDLYANPLKSRHDEIELRNGTIIDRHSGPAVGADGTVYGRVWTFRDTTDRVRAEKALRESERRLLNLMESIPQVVWTCLPDGWNLFFNHQWQEYTGQSLDESGGYGWQDVIHPDDRSDTALLGYEEKVFEVENRLRRADGTYRWFLIRGIPVVDAEGKVIHWFGTCTDIDDLKLSEELLRESQEELEIRVENRTRDLAIATLEAERANAAKSEFLSRMSHELRTPLNAILGFGQILERQPLNELQRESVGYILKGGRHLLGLINEILDISRVEAGRSDLSIEPVMVAEVLGESFAMVRNAAAERGITVEENLERFENVYVQADRQRLKQVLINLLSNAVKYNRPQGRITAYALDVEEGSFRIAIQDTGLGISEENRAKLFVPFERLGAGAEVEGTGLGLFLTRKLVSAMGGNLAVESQFGEGSTFSIDLARTLAPSETVLALEVVEDATASSVRSPELSERPRSILSIEDNSANILLLEKLFASCPDIALSTATHGMEGLNLARQSEPDLILLDLHLPDLPGIEVLKRLRRSATTSHIPVIVISADTQPSSKDAALAAGANAFLAKPLDIERFRRTLDQYFAPTGTEEAPLKVAA